MAGLLSLERTARMRGTDSCGLVKGIGEKDLQFTWAHGRTIWKPYVQFYALLPTIALTT